MAMSKIEKAELGKIFSLQGRSHVCQIKIFWKIEKSYIKSLNPEATKIELYKEKIDMPNWILVLDFLIKMEIYNLKELVFLFLPLTGDFLILKNHRLLNSNYKIKRGSCPVTSTLNYCKNCIMQ